jgi:WD40 repeat protein
VRVVKGVSAFWDSNIVAATNHSDVRLAIWSPCNRFIAISPGHSTPVDILDSATLRPLQSLEFSQELPLKSEAFAFSPDSRTLTSLVRGHRNAEGWFVVSWDLQTGGVVGAIEWKAPRSSGVEKIYITYSMNGKAVSILSVNGYFAIIPIYDVVSSVHIHNVDHRTRTNPDLRLEAQYAYNSWAHGESLRFATLGPAGVTIREVGFTPGATLVEVETISIPDNIAEMLFGQFSPAPAEFHPPSCRLAFITNGGSLVVWDVRASRFLLHDTDISPLYPLTFSSDGRFFACTTRESGIYIWRESSNGYAIVQKLMQSTRLPNLLLSPNGESIIAFRGFTIQLWHTIVSTTTTSSVFPQVPHNTGESFYLEFLPDEPLAVTARMGDRTITVVDLNSGIPQLTIDTCIHVYGFRATANTIVVIGDQKAITWNMPRGMFPPGARMNAENGAHTMHFGHITNCVVRAASISLDSQYVAFAGYEAREGKFLDVYCTSTGKNLRTPQLPTPLWFAPGGHEIWCATANFEAKVFTITQDTLYHTRTVPGIEYGAWGCPWASSDEYRITKEGWVLRRDGKRLLMLPPLWRSSFGVKEVVWNGKFLGLLHATLPEPVVLELEP